MKTYNIFISHSWKYSDDYERLSKLISGRPYFNSIDYSVPPYKPIVGANTDSQLRAKIRSRIQPCHIVIFIGGMYASYSKWIQEEIEISKSFSTPKPIIVMKPLGQKVISRVVSKEAICPPIPWRTENIIDAIRKYGISPSS